MDFLMYFHGSPNQTMNRHSAKAEKVMLRFISTLTSACTWKDCFKKQNSLRFPQMQLTVFSEIMRPVAYFHGVNTLVIIKITIALCSVYPEIDILGLFMAVLSCFREFTYTQEGLIYEPECSIYWAREASLCTGCSG